jgi:endonuclease/exonuclease/phosphatase family metal-dependent hydrolase
MKAFLPILLIVSSFVACVHPRPPAMLPAAVAACRNGGVEWLTPDDRQSRLRLDSWCTGVGPAVIRALPRDTEPTPADRIVFVSWNVHVGNGNVPALVQDLRAGRLTNGQPVRHFVLLLQEALRVGQTPSFRPGASGARRIAASRRAFEIDQLSRALGLSMIYVPSMRNGNDPSDPPEDRGNAILSTLPLSSPLAVELPGVRQRRVALFAKIRSASTSEVMSVGVVHLDALADFRRFWLFGTPSMRELQIKSLAAVMPRGSLVVGADLNTWHGAQEPAPTYLRGLFGATEIITDASRPFHRPLDYMFFRPASGTRAGYRIIPNAYGSDHYPLVGQEFS